MAELLSISMVLTAAAILAVGFPVAFALGGTAIVFALVSFAMGQLHFSLITLIPSRILGSVLESPLWAQIGATLFICAAIYNVIFRKPFWTVLKRSTFVVSGVFAAWIGLVVFNTVFMALGGTDIWHDVILSLGVDEGAVRYFSERALLAYLILGCLLLQAIKTIQFDCKESH